MMSLYHDEMPPDVDEEACPICGRPYIGRHGMCLRATMICARSATTTTRETNNEHV
ncbi:hypothetical protein [Bifidobacterium bombi]|uniref:Uncharacterized protein n=1 Tax=Bifidobacterium bombi DSM 19703 TaxID=1341695 RepID=A0A080N3E9_9BIFI|nr:hypothetical protein [Bifidobacterium bombi]KFF31667.1 hypothetical protein BBOMB_1054 [Bifidobacterium bombi DSM 19703]